MGQTAQPNFNSFEILQVGVTTVSSDGSPTNWTTVAHNLGYAPAVLAYMNNVFLSGITGVGNIPLPMWTSSQTDTVNHVFIQKSYMMASVDTQNIYIILYNALGTTIPAFTVKYYLLREKAN